MAITPDQAGFKKAITEADEWERRIDNYFQEEHSGERFLMDVGRGLPSMAAREILVQRYKAAGWQNIKFVSDQRDGDWIELFPQRTP